MVEKLDQPFTADGRIAQKAADSGLDVSFTKAAFAIPQLGELSEVVATPFGWHVIRLLEVRPGFRAPLDERIRRLEPAMLRARIGPLHEAKLAELRKTANVALLATDFDLSLPRIAEAEPPKHSRRA